MKILINDVPISFELEHETRAGEIYDGVVQWLNGSGHHVEYTMVNGERVSDTDLGWRDLEIATVDTIALRAHSIHQSEVEQLETIITYVDLFRRVMTEGTAEQIDAVMEELPFVTGGIKRITPDLAGLLDEPVREADLAESATRSLAARRAEELAPLLEQRQRELLDPEHEMRATISALGAVLPAFEDVPTQLQTGQQRKAMASVARFSELASRMLRIIPLLIEIRPPLHDATVGDGTYRTYVHIRQIQTDAGTFTMPIDLTLATVDGDEVQTVWNDAADQWFVLTTTSPVGNVLFD
ncbi:MAG: hypothetical protein MI724_02990, partial [Spirochaetales bacterium]|nr:hypothetical protein [Spirochaetales bacterium]